MDKDKIQEKLHEQYYDAIKLLQDNNDIIDALPKPIYKSFFSIMPRLIERLKEEEQELKEMLTGEDKKSIDYIDIIEDLKLCALKIEICNKLYKDALEEVKIEKEGEEAKHKNIIFSKTSSGNVYLQKDLKSIPEEYYDSILDCIEKIENGYKEENTEKAKSFTTTNSKLAGIHEIKPFKIRVAYKILDKNIVYILMVRVKKDNNESLDREEIIKRANNTEKEYNQIKKEIKKESNKNKLLEEHKKIKEEIEQYLLSNKRGRLHG